MLQRMKCLTPNMNLSVRALGAPTALPTPQGLSFLFLVQEPILCPWAISPCPSNAIWPRSISPQPCSACLGVHSYVLGQPHLSQPQEPAPHPCTQGWGCPPGFPAPGRGSGMCPLCCTPLWWTCGTPATPLGDLLLLLSPGSFSFPHVLSPLFFAPFPL